MEINRRVSVRLILSLVEPPGLAGDGESAAQSLMMTRLMKLPREPNSGTQPAELAVIDEEGPVRI